MQGKRQLKSKILFRVKELVNSRLALDILLIRILEDRLPKKKIILTARIKRNNLKPRWKQEMLQIIIKFKLIQEKTEKAVVKKITRK